MRPTWDEYFMEIAELIKTRSTCVSRQIGAVLVRDKKILTTGYNGAPKGIPHCTKETCLRKNIPSGEKLDLCMAVHAEQNAIVQAACSSTNISGATLYCTHGPPCLLCAKMIINAGIKRIVYKDAYPSGPLVDNILKVGEVEVEQIK